MYQAYLQYFTFCFVLNYLYFTIQPRKRNNKLLISSNFKTNPKNGNSP